MQSFASDGSKVYIEQDLGQEHELREKKSGAALNIEKPVISQGGALPTNNFFLLMPIAVLAGLLSFLSPCCLSLIPGYFAHTLKTKGRIFRGSVGFFMGLALVLALLGASAAFLGMFAANQTKQSLGQLAGVILVVFGILTLLEKGFPGLGVKAKAPATFGKSVVFGALFGIGWSPCIGPILLSLFALAASTSTLLEGSALLLAYAGGLSIPLLLLSLYFDNIDRDSLVWRIIKGRLLRTRILGREFCVHSTSLISGMLLIILGVLMAFGYLYAFNTLVPAWLQKAEGDLLSFFGSMMR